MSTGRGYPTRSSELPIIRRRRVRIFKRIVGTIPERPEARLFELTPKEFIVLTMLYQTNIYYTVNLADIVIKYGALLVFFSFLALQLLISMPILMLFIFMSSYSKKGYLRFWDCVPMFAGLGYTLLLTKFLYAMYSIVYSSVAFIFILETLFTRNLLDRIATCSFDTTEICIPMYPSERTNLTCDHAVHARDRNETVLIATQFFIRRRIMKYDRFGAEEITVNSRLMFASLFLWFVVFAAAIFGVKRIRRFSLNLQAIVYYIMSTTIIYSMVCTSDTKSLLTQVHNAHSFEYWNAILHLTTDPFILSDVIWIGTMKPRTLGAKHAGLIIGLLKIAVYLVLILYVERTTQLTRGHYRFTDPRCLVVVGHDVVLSLIPDVIIRIRFGMMFSLFWFIGLVYTGVSTATFAIIGIVSALTERFVGLSRYRLMTYLVICVCASLYQILLCTNKNMSIIFTFKIYGLSFLTTMVFLLTSLALMFIYSTKRIIDDYTFTYGMSPNKFWAASWKTIPIVALFSFIFMLCHIKNSVDVIFASIYVQLASYFKCTIFLCPIVIVLMAKCCRHVKYRTLKAITKPSESWGPHDRNKKQSRQFFFPQRDVRYRSNVVRCPHKCVANSKKFTDANRAQTKKLDRLVRKIQRDKFIDRKIARTILREFKPVRSRSPSRSPKHSD